MHTTYKALSQAVWACLEPYHFIKKSLTCHALKETIALNNDGMGITGS
ncbi:hypothetical protein Sez_0188 [Streptococcus equi subsp. zooepidemicus MGCS10565]|uniref:Uncharacterized protein n=1 Tax=Streptococcus equi subsp. zooepidemicus (strain MGCS10565) TaxID=552526 RepID=B4U0C3_STREM|nr:hypothetical protein Sez_0188 [Streptococcus equi subsp. zooepidemicus MGCS10565]